MTTPTNSLTYVSIVLPSKGIFYDGAIPNGMVEVRKMSVGDITAFESTGGTAAEKIDRLLKACVRLPAQFPHANLLMTDRMALLFSLRTVTFNGAKYNFDFKCKYCGKVNHRECDLTTDITVKTPEDDAAEPIQVTLPSSGVVLSMRFLRGKDEEAVAKYAKRIKMKSIDNDDPSLPYRIATQILNLDGEEANILDKERWVRALGLDDLMHIANEIERLEPGLDTTLTPDCGSCSSTNEVTLELTAEFFRPRAR